MVEEVVICSRCVMDTTDKDIQFDEKGVCNHCKRYENRIKNDLHYDEKGQALLSRMLDEIKAKGKNNDYDVVIGVSGGVDSTTVAYKVKKELGLRPLAVHLDNGWNSEIAVNNISKTLNALNIDLYTYVIDWNEFKDLQYSFLKSSFINSEIPTDHAIIAILFKVAAEHNIPFIFGGSNIVTEGIHAFSWVYDYKDWKLIKGIHKQFGTYPLKSFPHFSLFRMVYYTFIKRIKFVPVLNFVKYDREEAMKLIEDELGWTNYGGKHYESIFTRFYQSYILPVKYNVDKRKAHYSALIMSGGMTRDEALKALDTETYPKELMKHDKAFVAKKFGLTIEQFDNLMALPIKSFEDYPNSYGLYKKLSYFVQFSKKFLTYNK